MSNPFAASLSSGFNQASQCHAIHKMVSITLPEHVENALDIPADFYLSFEEMVTKYGFDVTPYNVTTPDLYVLGNFRIRRKGLKPGAPAVFL